MGHGPFFIKLTERNYSNQGQTEVVRDYDRQVLQITASNVIKIDSTSTTTCTPGSTSGYGEWTNITSKKVSIVKADGTAFSKGTVGISKDGLSVETTVICEQYGNSRTSCN